MVSKFSIKDLRKYEKSFKYPNLIKISKKLFYKKSLWYQIFFFISKFSIKDLRKYEKSFKYPNLIKISKKLFYKKSLWY